MIKKFDITAGTAPVDGTSNATTEPATDSMVSPFDRYPFYGPLDDYGKNKRKGKKSKKKGKGKKRGRRSKSRSRETDRDREERAQARERELVWRNGYLTAQNETYRAIIGMSIAASQGKLDSNVAQVGLSLPPPNNPPQTDRTAPPQGKEQ